MDCIKVKKILSRYQDNELEVKERAVVTTHLDICADCKRELAEMENLISDLANLESVPIKSNLNHKIMSQIYDREAKKTSHMPFKFASLIYSMIFIIFFSLGFILIETDKPQNNNLIDERAEMYIASILTNEQELGLLNIQESIIGIVEDEVNYEN